MSQARTKVVGTIALLVRSPAGFRDLASHKQGTRSGINQARCNCRNTPPSLRANVAARVVALSRTTNQRKESMPSIKENASRPAKPQPDPLRKLSFGAINRKASNARTAYPILPDPNGELAIITARIIERTAQIEVLDGALTIDKSELKTLATPFYFTQASGKVDVASSVSAVSPTGEVLITFANRYGRLESEAALLPILGEQTSTFFRQAFALEIDGDKLPAEQAQELLNELQQLFARYHAAEALKVKEGIKPVPDFHTVRHMALSPQQNLAINQVCPIIAMVKTKGRIKENA